MIRVLQVLPRLRRGGSQTMVMNIYKKIDRSKIQFDFIIFSSDHDDYYDEVKKLGGRIFLFTKFNGLNYFKIKKEWSQFFKEHHEYKILHSHVRSFASIYIPIAKRFGVKTIIHSHSTSNEKNIKGLGKWFLELPLRWQADYLFACSNKAGAWLYGEHSLKKQNYILFPNGIDLEYFQYNFALRSEVRSEYKINNNSYVLGHVGGLEKPKNHMFLLDIFKKYSEINSNSKLLLVGEGTLENLIKEKAKELGVLDNIIFAGLQDDVSKFLSAMDVFVFPSTREGLPVSAVEAQANGLPCLLSKKISEEVVLTENCKILDLNDIDFWIECIKDSKRTNNVSYENGLNLYDINETSKKYEDFCLRIYHE